MVVSFAQGLGALVVAALVFFGFGGVGGLSVKVRGFLALALVLVWFFLSPVFFPLMTFH